jgi:hypothetical protein
VRPAIWVVLALAGCASPGILGGPTEDTTTVLCPDGTRCPLAYPSCPPPGSRQYGGRCEAADPDPANFFGDRARDASR